MNFLERFSTHILMSNFMKTHPDGAEFFRADRQTCRFSQFCENTEKSSLFKGTVRLITLLTTKLLVCILTKVIRRTISRHVSLESISILSFHTLLKGSLGLFFPIFPDLTFVYTPHTPHMYYIFSYLNPFALLLPNNFQ
jgi:hypothetical protein